MANTTGQKYGGRTKGTPNKETSEIRANFQSLINDNLEQMKEDLKALEPKDRIKAILDLSKFVIPTLKATEFTAPETAKITPVTIIFKKIVHEDN